MKKKFFTLLTIILSFQGYSQNVNTHLIGQCTSPSSARSVTVFGDYAYVADVVHLRIINIANPAEPFEEGNYQTYQSSEDLAVSGDFAFVADWDPGLRIIDISNSAAPFEIGYYDPGDARGVDIDENYAFVASGGAGLWILDIGDPENYIVGGNCDTPDYAVEVFASDNFAYVADADAGLRIIDVGDPYDPIEVGYYDTPGTARGVCVEGNFAFVTDGWEGLRIIDVSNQESPSEVGHYNTPGYAFCVIVSDGFAYVTDGDLHILDISDPTTPTESGFYDAPYFTQGLDVKGSLVFVAAGSDGLLIIKNELVNDINQHSAISSIIDVNCSPNPAGREVNFSFNLPEACTFRITLYNETGEALKDVYRAQNKPGECNMMLELGNFPEGIYLYNVTAQSTDTEKEYYANGKLIKF